MTVQQMTSVTTPLRYPGGKARALRKILPLIPQQFSEYREPFVGGGSVFISVKKMHPDIDFKINDLNPEVYAFWKTMKENSGPLIKSITQIKSKSIDGRVLHCKLSKGRASGTFGRALRFYVLNRITYSGISDCGGYSAESFSKRFTTSKIQSLSEVASLLENVTVTNNSYETLLSNEGKKVFIFLDPPYWRQRKVSLYGKKGDLNRFFDHAAFAKEVRKCKHTWLITCDDSEFMRDLFSFANIYPWDLKYNGFHKKNAINGKELFISNYKIKQDLLA